MSILPDNLLTKITVRECPTCSYVDRHPKIWCSNCGSKYEIVQMTEGQYRKMALEQGERIFHESARGGKIERE
jgi:hypothetical protein